MEEGRQQPVVAVQLEAPVPSPRIELMKLEFPEECLLVRPDWDDDYDRRRFLVKRKRYYDARLQEWVGPPPSPSPAVTSRRLLQNSPSPAVTTRHLQQ